MRKLLFLIACMLCAMTGHAQQGPQATTRYGVLEGVCKRV